MQRLDDTNFLLYAAANYSNTLHYDSDEFFDDLKKFKYLKRLFSRYHDKRELKERLILNHMITLFNVFNYEANIKMLFYRIDPEHWYILKTFLIYMQRVPEHITHVGDYGTIDVSLIPVDLRIASTLREL